MAAVVTDDSPPGVADAPRLAGPKVGLAALGGVSAANFIAVVSTAAQGLVCVRLLSQVEYGRMAGFLSISLMLSLLVGLGLTTKVAGDLARGRGRSGHPSEQTVLGTLLAVRLVTVLPVLLLGGALAAATGEGLYLFATALGSLQMIADFWLGVHQGMQRLWAVAVGAAFNSVLSLAAIAALQPARAEEVFVLLAAAALVNGGVLLLAAVRTGAGWPRPSWFSWPYARRALGGTGLIHAGLLLQMAFLVAALSWLGAAGQHEASADLAVALSLVRLPLLALAPLVVSLYFPMASARAAASDFQTRYRGWFERWARACLCLSAAGAAFLFVWPEPAITLLATDRYLHTAPLVRVLSPLALLLVADALVTNTLWGVQATAQAMAAAGVRVAAFGLLSLLALLIAGEQRELATAFGAAMTVAGTAGLAVQARALAQTTSWGVPWLAVARAAAGAGLVVAAGRLVAEAAGWNAAMLQLVPAVVATGLLAVAAAILLSGLRPAQVLALGDERATASGDGALL